MKERTLNNISSKLREQVLRTLLYYDIFNYPLKVDEVYRFLGIGGVDKSSVQSCLTELRDMKMIYQFGDFYCMKNSKAVIERRVKGNSHADRLLSLASRRSNFISKFPFVRAVLASGSFSKGYMDEKSDLDFFIITEPGRLWIARTLLVLYKRVFLFNSRKYFCVNYFVDEEHLEIEEKNLFTATELATVLPLSGARHYEDLLLSNPWLRDFYPNFAPRSVANVPSGSASLLKNFMEKFLNIFFSKALERFFHKMTLARWKKLYEKDYSATDFKVAFKSKPYASKVHPSNFQRTVIEVYEEKLRACGIGDKASSDDNVFVIDNTVLLQSSSGL
jgi:hypothetical protein